MSIFIQIFLHDGLGKTIFSACVHFGRSRSSKVIDFGTNRKRVCDFLLVHHSNLGPILHRFGDIAGFLCSWVTPPRFHPNFRGVSVAPDRSCCGQPEHKPQANQPWNYFQSIPTCVITIHPCNVTDGHTANDMRSQDRALHYSASRGKSQTTMRFYQWYPIIPNIYE